MVQNVCGIGNLVESRGENKWITKKGDVVEFELNEREVIRLHNLEDEGKVQKFIDSECLRLMAPYTPFLNGQLEKSATLGTVIGSGHIQYNSPYARFLYYGKVMVDPNTGSTYAPLYGKKVLTENELKYSTVRHSKAGKMWFERMKVDKKEQIIRGCRKLISSK